MIQENNEFKWDDEKVLEFVRYTKNESPLMQGRYSDLEDFKKSKQQDTIQKDWEIISYQSSHGTIWEAKGLFINKINMQIHSVKRLSDGEVFSVGDEIYNNCYEHRTIKAFELNELYGGIMVNCSHNESVSENSLSSIHKTDKGKEIYFAEQLLLKNGYVLTNKEKVIHSMTSFGIKKREIKKTPLFITHDGVDIYKGDDFFSVNKNTLEIFPQVACNLCHHVHNEINFLEFSTREEAEKYIALNKKEVLFTTVDGKAIYHRDRFYTITDNFEIVFSDAVKGIHLTPQIISRTYSSIEKVSEYILMNKPVLSVNDVKEYIEKYFDYPNGINVKMIEKIAEQKINDQ